MAINAVGILEQGLFVFIAKPKLSSARHGCFVTLSKATEKESDVTKTAT